MKIKIATGPVRWFLTKYKYAGITLPPFGIFIINERIDDKELIKHEEKHWKQYEKMGLIRFYTLYLYYNMRYGYWNNPMEKEARGEKIEK